MIFAKYPSMDDLNRALDEAFASVIKRPLRKLDSIDGKGGKGMLSAEGERLARIMAAEGRSQKVIAGRLGVSRAVLWRRGIATRTSK
jgi:transcriptional regulator with PAS, ATPase and Fis domain